MNFILVALAISSLLGAGCGRGRKHDDLTTRQQALGDPAWAPGVNYQGGTRVIYNGIVYEARQTHVSQAQYPPPGNVTLWFKPTPTGLTEWSYQTKYIVGSDVSYKGLLYECTQLHWVDDPTWTPDRVSSLWRCASSACGGTCTGQPSGALCDDGNSCTSDACNSSGQCVGTPTASCGTAPAKPRALLVVEKIPLTPDNPGDEVLRARLSALGYEVDLRKGSEAVSADATGKAVMVISESVASGDVGATFRTTAVPIVSLEVNHWADMLMASGTTSTDRGSVDADKIAIAAGAHPLAAGFSGTVTVATTASKINWAKTLGSGAVKVATVDGDPAKATVFAYDLGASLVGGTAAPARRVGLFMSKLVPTTLNATGAAILDAAIRWAAEPPALLVVGDTSLSNPSDVALRDRLKAMNLPVSIVDDSASDSNAQGKQVVVISESADSDTLGNKYKTVSTPVVCLEPKVFDNLGMTGPQGWDTNMGSISGQTALDIVNSEHPLAAGLSGRVTVTSASATVFWGVPGPAAFGIAVPVTGPPGRYSIFGYEKGAAMINATAPARRVGWFAKADVPVVLTNSGWKLFEAAVQWASGKAGQDAALCVGKSEDADCSTGAHVCEQGLCKSGRCVPKDQPGACRVVPSVDCVVAGEAGKYTAVFGYENAAQENVYASPAEGLNSLGSGKTGQPHWFEVGDHRAALTVEFDGNDLPWTVGNRTATANANTRRCTMDSPQPYFKVVTLPDGSRLNLPADPSLVVSNSTLPTDSFSGVAAGTTAGGLTVTSDGATTYSVPLWVPEGRAGATPALSLQYGSRQGNGPLGVGWSVGGLSSIERCPFSIAHGDQLAVPYTYLEPFVRHFPPPIGDVRVDEPFALCLDGRRLKAIPPSGELGPMRKFYVEGDLRTTVEAPDHDADGPTSINVYDGEGRHFVYGGPDWVAGPLFNRDPANRYTTNGRFGWPLTSVTDRWGNKVEFVYSKTEDASHGIDHHITEIRYAHVGNQAHRRINFEYETTDRSDPVVRFERGLKLVTPRKLKKITMSGPAPSEIGVLRSYEFTYGIGIPSGKSLLSQIKECDKLGVCKAPLVFGYQNGDLAFEEVGGISMPSSARRYIGEESGFPTLLVVDLNHDGRDDVMFRYFDNTAFSGPRIAWAYALSKADSLGFDSPVVTNIPVGTFLGVTSEPSVVYLRGQAQPSILLEFGNSTNGPENTFNAYTPSLTDLSHFELDSRFYTPGSGGPTPVRGFSHYVADLNGDGLPEFMAKDSSTHHWKLFINSKEEFPLSRDWATDFGSADLSNAYTVDVDGDHRPELLLSDGSENYTAQYSPRSPGSLGLFRNATNLPVATAQGSGFRYLFPDINGDGIPDAVRIDNAHLDGSKSQGFVRVSTANGFLDDAEGTAWPDTHKVGPIFEGVGAFVESGLRATDLNQNGRDEILLMGNGGGVRYVEADHEGRWTTFGTLPGMFPNCVKLVDAGFKLCQVLDIDGDGMSDLIIGASDRLHVFHNTSKRADLLISVKDSLTATTEVTYKSIADPAVHTPTNSAVDVYPRLYMTRGLDVVQEVRRDNGTGFNRETHSYFRATTDQRGRGFLGFGIQKVTDEATGVESIVTYDNVTRHGGLYPFADMPNLSVTRYPLTSDRTRRLTVVESTHYKLLPSRLNDPGADQTEPAERTPHTVVADFESSARYESEVWEPAIPPTADRLSQAQTSLGFEEIFGTLTSATTTWPNGESMAWTLTNFEDKTANPRVLGIPRRIEVEYTVSPRGGNPERKQKIARTFTPDSRGAIIEEVLEPGTEAPDAPSLKVTKTNTFNGFGQVTRRVTKAVATAPWPAGAQVPAPPATYTPEEQERSLEIGYDEESVFPRTLTTQPLDQTETLIYHPGLGVLVGHVSASNLLTAFTFDGFGRLRKEVRADGNDLEMSYSRPAGTTFVVFERRLGGGEATTFFDRLGRPETSVTPGSRGRSIHVKSKYFNTGLLAGVSVPAFDAPSSQYAEFTYDSAGRPLTSTAPDGVATSYAYSRRRVDVTDGRGKQSHSTYDELGRVAESGGGGLTTTFEYGLFGRLDKTTIPGGKTVTVGYDKLGRRTSLSDPDAGDFTYVYNAFGERVHSLDKRGHNETRKYDAAGRVLQVISADGTTTFDYDSAGFGLGEIGGATSPDHVQTEFVYDAKGRVEKERLTIPGLASVLETGYKFDSVGRLSGLTFPKVADRDRLELSVQYSRHNAADALRTKYASGQPLWQVEDRSPFGAVSQEIFGNRLRVVRAPNSRLGLLEHLDAGFVGTGLTGSGFDPEDLEQSVPGLESGAAKIQSLAFAYDNSRNLMSRTDSRDSMKVVTDTLTHDDINRIDTWTARVASTETAFKYTYDPAGNLSGRQVTSGSGTVLRFDHEGEAKQAGPHAVTGSTFGTSYKYDRKGLQFEAPGRAVEYSEFDLPKVLNLGPMQDRHDLIYDAFGGRAHKTGGGSETFYGTSYERRVEAGKILHVFYVPGEGRTVAQIVWEEQSGRIVNEQVEYLQDDHLGSTETVTAAPGSVVGRLRFDPFGRQVKIDDPTTATSGFPGNVRLGYTGHEHDLESGLINMQGRIYDPLTAHFLTPDPIVQSPGWGPSYNRYSYVFNSPVTLTDPSGFAPDDKKSGPFCGFPYFICRVPPPIGPGGSGGKGSGGGGSTSDDDRSRVGKGSSRPPTILPPGNPATAITPGWWRLTPEQQAKYAAQMGSPTARKTLDDYRYVGNALGLHSEQPWGAADQFQDRRLEMTFIYFAAPLALFLGAEAYGAAWMYAATHPGLVLFGTEVGLGAGGASLGAAGALPLLPRSLGAAANITLRSRIKESTYAIRLAQELGEAAQQDVNHLTRALLNGNMNPGIGTRALGKGFFELRGAHAGRVIIKQTGAGSFDIVGKFQAHVRGDVANSRMIQRLMDAFE
jgi:RHS repeat-associated protein